MPMKELFGGLVIGLALGAGGLYLVQQSGPAPVDTCDGICGLGTICDEGVCLVDEHTDPVPEAEEPESKPKSKRRGGRRGKGGDAGAEDGVEEAGEGSGPAIDDDSGIPRFDANKDQTIGMSDGSGRLSDSQVDRELDSLDKPFQACVRDANERVAELGTGTVKFSFGVAGTGKVTGVNVSAPSNLSDAGIVPCVRKAIHAHKFPAFDGPEMKVSSSFSVR